MTLEDAREAIDKAITDMDRLIGWVNCRIDYPELRALAIGEGNKKNVNATRLRKECAAALARVSELETECEANRKTIADYRRRLTADSAGFALLGK